MVIHTPAIVLKSFSYGESSIIARCFSREQGKISLIIKGAKRSKSPKSVHFQPLSYVELIYNYQPKRDLQTISKVSFLGYWSKILSNLRSITLSSAEILGIDKRVGSLDPGKDATFFITDKHPLQISSNPIEAYIMGKKVDLSDRQKMLYEKYKEKYRRKGRLD